MKEITILIDEPNNHTSRIRDSIALVNASQNYFYLKIAESIQLTHQNGGLVNAEAAARQIKEAYTEGKVIWITSRGFDDNWFSHRSRNGAVISIFDWEKHFAPPSLRAYLIYQLAQALLTLEADLSEAMLLRLDHEPPVGCLNDFNLHKPDIKLSMVAGNMCLQCEGLLLQYGVNQNALDALRRIISVVRDEAIGRPKIIDPLSAFVIMRFSQNDENDHAYQYGVKPGLTDVGLRVRRADDTVQSAQILDQVFHYIQTNRFIVAKVDAENLNVYFELGAAMGLSKDVVLISESSLVVNLPSDLRNWECLTYNKGNYEQLRERIAQFYKDNYRLDVFQ